MPEGDAFVYNNGKVQLLKAATGTAPSGTLKVALILSYTPNIDTHDTWADAKAAGTEASGTGYTARGTALASAAVTKDTTNDRAALDGTDTTYTALDVGTPSHAVVYWDTGTDATSNLLMYFVLGRASNGGNYTISWNALGLLTLA